MTDPAPPPPIRRRRPAFRALTAVAVMLGLILTLMAVLYLNRRAAAREVLVGWLERQGIEAEVEVERVEIDGFVGRIRVGDPDNPDFVVERAEVDYAIAWPWSGGFGVTPSRIRLVRPVLRASWLRGEMSLGSLDPLVEEFTGRPPRPDSRAPLVLVEGGRVRLTTEYGPVSILGDARIDEGRLERLSARMPASGLRSGEVSASGVEATLEATTTGDRLSFRLDVAATDFALPGAAGGAAVATLRGETPYPDLERRSGDGRLDLDLSLRAGSLSLGGTRLTDAVLTGGFNGQTRGWVDDLALDGRAALGLDFAAAEGPDLAASGGRGRLSGAARLARSADGLTWRMDDAALTARLARGRSGALSVQGLAATSPRLDFGGRGRAFELSGPLRLTADRAVSGDLALAGVRSGLAVDVVRDGPLTLTLDGDLAAARGSWPLFGPAAADDVPELGAMKTALGNFALSAPSVRLVAGDDGVRLDLRRPAVVRPANGGVLTIAAAGGPAYAAAPGEAGGGALALTATRGAGLPQARIAVPRWRLTPDGFSAALDGEAALDFGLARTARTTLKGDLAQSGGRLTFTAASCSQVSVERLELGENDLFDLSGALCPSGGPLVVVQGGGWRAAGRLADVAASAPFLALRVEDGAGRLVATGGASGIGLEIAADRARVVDATSPVRFNPAEATGAVRLADETWSGGFDLSVDGRPVGALTVAHDGRSGRGGVVIASRDLVFTEGGLQPATLSPLVEGFIQPPVTGQARFDGRIDWTPTDGTSSGVLSIPGLDFISPAGPIAGLRGDIVFTSLTPLVTAPDQRLTVDSLESVVPLTGVEVGFALDKAALSVSGGVLEVGGGRLRLEPFAVPLDPDQPVEGVLVLETVQLGELISGAGFGDKVRLDAVVSGRVPFIWRRDSGVRVADGHLYAVQPGRLSIAREALSGLEAGGGGEAVPPNTVQDLAYQAMENLAFDLLDAEVNSLDGGRIGVLFHIRGRHDPPQRQELRLSLSEFISREFLNRELPLPSDTGIDLTLDTTLNLDQLVSDIIALNRARNGEE